jgi:hypothetical protein
LHPETFRVHHVGFVGTQAIDVCNLENAEEIRKFSAETSKEENMNVLEKFAAFLQGEVGTQDGVGTQNPTTGVDPLVFENQTLKSELEKVRQASLASSVKAKVAEFTQKNLINPSQAEVAEKLLASDVASDFEAFVLKNEKMTFGESSVSDILGSVFTAAPIQDDVSEADIAILTKKPEVW